MAKAIGPSFATELKVAGLLGLPFAWGADGGFTFDPALTQVQITAILAVYAAHDPSALVPDLHALDVADVKAKIDLLVAAGLIPQTIKDFVQALRRVL